MAARAALAAPLALSLAVHAAAIALLAGGGLLRNRSPVHDAERVIPVQRAAAEPAPARLALDLAAPPSAAGAEAVELDTVDPRYRPYLLGVRRRIWERWSGPAVAPGQPARGTLIVEFTLTRGGGVAAAGVREPSGVPALDRAALDAVARAAPFTPLPASIGGDALRVRARFTYD